jgi:rSAM/selenodomain-associated transferase 2
MSAKTARLSVVIPTLNAASTLEATLVALSPGALAQIVVSDGGSSDATAAIARVASVQFVEGPSGRGGQLQRGAAAANGDWLLFLHADTRLDSEWWSVVSTHMATHPQSAAYFQFALDDPSTAAKQLERIVAWRCRTFSLPYGDQGLLISRALYNAVGGYRDMPLMEDVDLVRRIGAKRLCALSCRAVTSAAKFQRSGYRARSVRNVFCLGLYFLGLPPKLIKRVYG